MKSNPLTSPDLLNATSSPESADGVALSNSPTGQPISRSGLGVALVSPSAQRGAKKGERTKGISGPSLPSLSPSADLSTSLASRLQARLDTVGSMEYMQTWRLRNTPSGRQYWAHTASALRTCGNGFTGWPTPTCYNREDTVEARAERGKKYGFGPALTLPMAAQMVEVPVGQTLNSCPTGTGSRGVLSPEHLRWLMGFPAEWGYCGATAMQSCQKSRKPSSRRTSKSVELASPNQQLN